MGDGRRSTMRHPAEKPGILRALGSSGRSTRHGAAGAGWGPGDRTERRCQRVSSGIGDTRGKVGQARLARQGRETVDGSPSGIRPKKLGIPRALGSSGFSARELGRAPAEPSSPIPSRNSTLFAAPMPPRPAAFPPAPRHLPLTGHPVRFSRHHAPYLLVRSVEVFISENP